MIVYSFVRKGGTRTVPEPGGALLPTLLPPCCEWPDALTRPVDEPPPPLPPLVSFCKLPLCMRAGGGPPSPPIGPPGSIIEPLPPPKPPPIRTFAAAAAAL